MSDIDPVEEELVCVECGEHFEAGDVLPFVFGEDDERALCADCAIRRGAIIDAETGEFRRAPNVGDLLG
jgi:hypothetical protein